MIALLAVALGVASLVYALRSRLPVLRRIVIESFPILVLAGAVDVLAGLTIENRFESFLAYPALLVLVPPFLEDSGSLGSILAARLSTKLHLGTLERSRAPWRAASEDFLLVYVYAVPVFLLLGLSADLASFVAGLDSPGSLQMVLVSLLGGLLRDDRGGLRRLLRRGRDPPARARPRQPRRPDRHVEPGPARRALAYPGHRDPRDHLNPRNRPLDG